MRTRARHACSSDRDGDGTLYIELRGACSDDRVGLDHDVRPVCCWWDAMRRCSLDGSSSLRCVPRPTVRGTLASACLAVHASRARS